MSGNISAGEGSLVAGANAVKETHNTLKARMTAIRGTVEEARGSWDGPSAKRFEELSTAWNEEVAKLNRTLDVLEAALRKTDQDQERDEEDSISEIGGIASVMS